MADNNAVFTVDIKLTGAQLKQITGDTKALGDAVKNTTSATKGLSASQSDAFDTQAKGVIGTANSTKSFSKLAQTINGGGSSSVVGAYATLAANTFALVAAFSALSKAAQLDQVFAGLKEAGARSGLSLASTAENLRNVTGNAIDMKLALQSTALIVSGGFNNKAVAQLGQVAKDTSFALGRDMTDSLDRLTKGVVKLQPKLLDELGIMVKLNDSNQAYATKLGKSVNSLTEYEKRQGFLNAVIAEGTLKFGGLSDAAGNTKAYDQMAATFVNLKNSVLGTVNVALLPLVSLLGQSPASLGGVAVLFASTISRQLLPGLTNLSAKTAAAAKASAEHITSLEAEATATANLAKAQQQAAVDSARSQIHSIDNGPKKANALTAAAASGDMAAQEERAKRLQQSIDLHQKQLTAMTAADPNNPKLGPKQDQVAIIQKQLDATNKLREAESSRAALALELDAQRRISLAAVTAAEQEEAALTQAATGISLASEGKVVQAFAAMKAASDAYTESLLANRKATNLAAAEADRLGAQAAPVILPKAGEADFVGPINQAEKGVLTLSDKFDKLKFNASQGLKVLGSSFLSFIPYIGLATLGFGLLDTAINALTPKSLLDARKASSDLNAVLADGADKINAYNKAFESTAAVGLRTTQALTIQSNAIAQIRDAYDEAAKKREDYEKKSGTSFGDSVNRAIGSDFELNNTKRAADATGNKLGDAANSLYGGEQFSSQKNQLRQTVEALGQLEELNPKVAKSVEDLHGGLDKLAKQDIATRIKVGKEIIDEIGKSAESAAGLISDLTQSLSDANTAIGDYLTASLPSTSFSAPLKAFDAVQNALRNIHSAIDTNKVSMTDWLKVLDQAGSNITKYLTPDADKKLTDTRAADATRQQILSDQRDTGGKPLTAEKQKQLDAANKILAANKDIYAIVEQQINQAETLFKNAQNSEILDKQRASLLQAQIAANSVNYANTAAGEAARIDDGNKVIEINKHILETQLAVREQEIGINEAKIATLSTQLKLNTATEHAAAVSVRQSYQAQIDVDRVKLNSGGKRNVAADAATRKDLDYQIAKTAEIDKQLGLYDQVGAFNRDDELANAAIVDLKNQIAALSLSETTEAQKQAAVLKAQNASLETQQGLLKTLNATYNSNADTATKISRTLSGTTEDLGGQLDDLAKTRDRSLTDNQSSYATQHAGLTGNIAEAEAARSKATGEQLDGNTALVKSLNDQLNLVDENNKAQQEQIQLTYTLAFYEKTVFDVRSKGIEIQQQSLSYIQKQYDAQKSLAQSVSAQNEAQIKLARSRAGIGDNSHTQAAEQIRAATEAYKMAVEESEIKKATINAEYALLEGQRDLLKEQLDAQKNALIQRASENPNEAPALKGRIDQLGSAESNLGNADLELARQSALKGVDVVVDTLKTELKNALAPQFSGDDPNSIIAGMKAERNASKAGYAALRPGAITPTSVTQIATPSQIADTVYKAAAASNQTKADNTQVTLSTVNETLGQILIAINKLNGTSSGGSSANLQGSQKAAFDQLQQNGQLNDTAIAGIIGRLQLESGFNLSAKNGNHVGIMQGDAQHQADFKSQFGENLQGAPLKDQIQFIINGLSKGAIEQLNAAPNAGAAATKFDEVYEKSGGQGDAIASKYANEIASAIVKALPGAIGKTAAMSTAGANDNNTVGSPIDVIGHKAAQSAMIPTTTKVTQPDLSSALSTKISATEELPDGAKTAEALKQASDAVEIYDKSVQGLKSNLSELGPNGAVVSALIDGSTAIADTLTKAAAQVADSGLGSTKSFVAMAQVASAAITTVEGLVTSSAQARESAIDKQIAQEEALDGKSAESVAKIDALQKKKDQIAKKAFDTNKKLMIAQAIIATAAGVAQALTLGPIVGPILATVIGAMGAAEIAIISSTQYQSSYTPPSTLPGSTLSIGSAGSPSIDVAKQNNNVGGEAAYAQANGSGVGTSSSNYQVVGSAYGGSLSRGYGSTAYLVGEKGPEIMTPDSPMTVRPIDSSNGGGAMNANITIHAMDSQGVADVLHGQRGNIIKMLREAANTNGQQFLENVDTNVYTRPNIGRL